MEWLTDEKKERSPMTPHESLDYRSETADAPSVVSRRDFLIRGSSVLAALALSDSPLFAQIWRTSEGEKVVPFLDQAPAPPDEPRGSVALAPGAAGAYRSPRTSRQALSRRPFGHVLCEGIRVGGTQRNSHSTKGRSWSRPMNWRLMAPSRPNLPLAM